MPYLRGYKSNGRKVTCDVCGEYWRQGDIRKGIFGKQKGLYVCPKDFDGIHPNEKNVPSKTDGKLDVIR